MLADFNSAERLTGSECAEVLVIGAGIAGLVVATSLSTRGVKTIVLESGPQIPTAESESLNAVLQTGQTYRGATKGRTRALGGTSVRWGGALLPFLPCDMEPHTAKWSVEWPVSFHELAVHFADIQRLFSLPTGPFELDADASSPTEDNFILRSAKLPTFRMRNIATALEKKIRAENLAIWLNATVTGFRLDDRGRVAAVTARNSSGSEGKISAKIICVCAGAIESTRLLLLLDAQHGDRIFKPDRQLGCWFSDHLSAPAATIIPHDRSALNATFGMRFVRSGMRDVRIEPSPSFRRAHALPGAFAHVTAHADEKSGFATLRSICHSLQSRLLPEASQMVALTRDLDWMIRAAGWRVFKARLLAPRNASFKLSLAIEQFPNATNTITLAPAQFDRNGIPLARIDWRINSEDLNNFQRLQSGLTRYWESRLAELGALRPTANELLRDLLQRDSDLFHPCGTTRMGRDVSLGVVDRNLRTFRINNLYVVSTSTFPSSGGSNPTFMLIAFALRAADRMAVTLDRRPTPEADCKWRMSLREFGLFGGIL